MKALLTYYCRYNVWANTKLAEFFEQQPEALLVQPIENSFPSIRQTVLHILSAEKSWLARLEQNSDNNIRVVDQFESTSALFRSLVKTSKSFSQFVDNQEDAYYEKELNYNTWDGTPWTMQSKIMVHHCMNHSTYHRGQLITLARQLGMKEGVPSTDILYYDRSL